MQIVIPMSGFGERFRRAGYTIPKPLIEVEGRPMIAHVLDLFPGERNVLFICNTDDLRDGRYGLEQTLRDLCPTGRVFGIAPHKRGPVHAVSQAFDQIDDDNEVVVNYCDFACYWRWSHFREFVRLSSCDGAIPAYRGFHPHSLRGNPYAFLRERDGWVSDIREKEAFTGKPMSEYASSGTYYFRTGRLMRERFAAAIDGDLTVGGEFYASLAYKPLLARGGRVAVYELQHFMQWGTPEDLADYLVWSRAFRGLIDPSRATVPRAGGTTIVPMAGLGARFAREGDADPKPLVEVSGQPMVARAVRDLPETQRRVFVTRRDLPRAAEIERAIEKSFPGSSVIELDRPTDGQARTALLGWERSATGAAGEGPITIGACDNGALYDSQRFVRAAGEADLLVWVTRGYPNAARQPRMYGWVATRLGTEVVTGVSVKQPLADPATDPIIIGTFTFRRPADFVRCVTRCIERGARINGEFYLDTCIEDALALGLDVRLFEIESYLCWGTPDDLRTFEYWQSCFHKWAGHPYRLERDFRVPARSLPSLEARYAERLPTMLRRG